MEIDATTFVNHPAIQDFLKTHPIPGGVGVNVAQIMMIANQAQTVMNFLKTMEEDRKKNEQLNEEDAQSYAQIQEVIKELAREEQLVRAPVRIRVDSPEDAVQMTLLITEQPI